MLLLLLGEVGSSLSPPFFVVKLSTFTNVRAHTSNTRNLRCCNGGIGLPVVRAELKIKSA